MTQAKLTSTSKNKSFKATTKEQSMQQALVSVHDLSGIACIGLSAELHKIFDKETIKRAISDIESSPLTIIIRSPDDIAYLHLQVVTRDLGDPLSQVSKLPKPPTPKARSKA